MWNNKFFWFSQPELTLTPADKNFLWLFVVFVVLGALLKIISRFTHHTVIAKLINKFGNSFLTSGFLGWVWFALRYENTPYFSDRYWAGIIILALIVWIVMIIKYLFTSFVTEKRAFDKLQLNSRYIPGSRK